MGRLLLVQGVDARLQNVWLAKIQPIDDVYICILPIEAD